MKFNQTVLSTVKKCLKCLGVAHPGYRLHYAIVILGVGQSKVLTAARRLKKREGEGSREHRPMHGEIMIQDQIANAVVTWTMVRRIKSGFMDTWLVDKNKGDNYAIISLWLVTTLVVPYEMATTNLAFNVLLKMTELVFESEVYCNIFFTLFLNVFR